LVYNDDTPSEGTSVRLQKLLSDVVNMSELSRISGVNRRMLDRYRAGSEPSLSAAARIARALNLPLDALVYDINVSKNNDTPQNVVLIPFLSVQGSAGPGVSNGDVEIVDSIPFSRMTLKRLGVRPEHAHAITSRGDSMLPTIADGQVLLIDTGMRRIKQDAIYALSIDDDIRIKRVQRGADGRLTLKSDNPNYDPEILSHADAEKLRVAGRVFWTEKVL
jgi:phage repressor protein C with HTH and peptisase S24 domain